MVYMGNKFTKLANNLKLHHVYSGCIMVIDVGRARSQLIKEYSENTEKYWT